MIGLNNQVWVTTALADEDVTKALVLCYSLRRSYTNRKVVVIASPKLTLGLREALIDGFDLVFYLDDDQNTPCLKPDDFAKLYALAILRSYEKCVYVSPTFLALRNSDDIFDGDLSRGFLCPENGIDTSIFLFRPSTLNFKALMAGLRASGKYNGTGIGPYINAWMKNQYSCEATALNGKYTIALNHGNMDIGFENDLSLVNLNNYYSNEKPEIKEDLEAQFGLFGKLIATHWQKILRDDVKPLIENSATITPMLPPSRYHREPIAIVGMSCRFPGSNNLEEFWELLFQGENGICNPPPFRWQREQCSIPRPDCSKTNAGFLKVPVDEFDAKFFGITPKEVLFMDPQHRLLCELIWEGLEDACIDPHTLHGTSGSVFMGSWTNDYKDILTHSGNDQFFRTYMGNAIGGAAARISFLLGMTGPSIATESGCSSAMVAVHMACRSLLLGETNLALACGVNLLLHPFDKDVMPMVVSPDGHCKTFSDDANGFARAEGGGVLILKRLSDAVKDGDRIWGLIRGSGVSQEGISKSMGTPTIHCEALAMKEALDDAQVSPEQVSYVETHGTGTVVGDPMEVAAIARAYKTPSRDEPLIIGSVKTNVGHTESCSGITGVIKVILALHHETIPAHRNFKKLNPSIDLEAIPACIPLDRKEWKRREGVPRIAGVSSFGIAGTDAHAIIEEAPILSATPNALQMSDNTCTERQLQILKVSTKSEEALVILLEKYRESLLQIKDANLADITYSANAGRANFQHRALIIGSSKEEMMTNIQQQKFLRGSAGEMESLGKICFLFTGQGSQYPGMAKSLHDTSPVFRLHFDYCEKILRESYDIKIKSVLWQNKSSNFDISRTIYSQTAIFCVEYALLKLWESWGLRPDYVLGHSLGEFAAAVGAGILSVENAIKLVAERSRLIDELPEGNMLVIRTDHSNVDTLMRKFAGQEKSKMLDYAAINSNEQTVVAGDAEVILKFSQFCNDNNLKTVILDSSHAFHSRHMDPMLEKYRHIAKSMKLSSNKQSKNIGYISGMKGDLISDPNQIVDPEYWVQHTREKVEFMKASKKAVALGCRIFIEIGPQPVLSALTMMNNDNNDLVCLPSLKRKEDDWQTMFTSLAKLYIKGATIDWNGLDMFRNRKKCRLPLYPFIGKKFWPDLVQADASETIHPLLGSPIQNASSTKLFQSGLNLRNEWYIKDHCIGQHVIFPGAGYLEMILAAGLFAVEGDNFKMEKLLSRPIKVENLSIEAPLELEESKTTQIQTVLEYDKKFTNDWNNLNVKIFHRVDRDSTKTSPWLQHAEATFSPLPTAEEQLVSLFDLTKFHKTIASDENNEEIILQVYEKLASVGLNFGSAFRSIEKLWNLESDGEANIVLTKVNIPSQMEQESGNKKSGIHCEYVVHPVVLDGMLQTLMMLKLSKNLKKKLYVPIRIGKFILLSKGDGLEGSQFYVQAFEKTGGPVSIGTENCTAFLINSEGKVLGIMTGVEFIETTAKAVESVLKQQTSTMPDLWEEVWRPKMGPLQYPVDLKLMLESLPSSKQFRDDLEREFNDRPQVVETFDRLGSLCYYNMLRALYECGWQIPTVFSVFNENELFSQLKIEQQFRKQFHYFLRVFEEEGLLQRNNDDDECQEWKIVQDPPSLENVHQILQSPIYTDELVEKFKSTSLFSKIGENLGTILKGTQSALSILFPADDSSSSGKKQEPTVSEFYSEYVKLLKFDEMVVQVFTHWQQSYQSQVAPGERFVFRVLEIGAGTGGYTEGLLETFDKNGIEFEYTYTDISSAFFPTAEKRFEKYLKNMKFKKLNIEEDPLSQGFVPEYFDLISASDVIHATRDLKESLRNVRTLLKPGGCFELFEMIRVNRFVTFMFGLLDGFWRFEDTAIRSGHCTVSKNTWIQVLGECGLPVVGVYPCANGHNANIKCIKTSYIDDDSEITDHSKLKTWVIFHQEDNSTSNFLIDKFSSLNGVSKRKLIIVQRGTHFENNEDSFKIRPDSEQDFMELFVNIEKNKCSFIEGIVYSWSLDKSMKAQADILQPYFYLIKTIATYLKQTSPPKISVLTNGAVPVEDNDLSQFQTSTLLGFTRCLKNEISEMPCRCIELGGSEAEDLKMQIFYELWSNDKDIQVVYQDRTRYIPKFQPYKPSVTDLELPSSSTDRFQLILPESKSISDLEFGSLDSFSLSPFEIEIQVKSSALNFRDVFSVLKPSEQFKDVNAIGFDFAGVVKRCGERVSKWNTGDLVFGVNVNGAALPSHIKLHEDDVLPVPEDMTLNEACTLPAVVATSFHCLIDIAKIRETDTVLIHTASGGVGLSAIEICKSVGATIIATAGSKRKQNYLRSIGIQHVFHSRNVEYGEQILNVTDGRGVDVVLNSLTSEGFKEATLKACAQGARFVEMSKLSIWEPEEVKRLRPDVEYTIVDVSSMESSAWRRLLKSLKELADKKTINPIPYVRFNGLNIREALQYMQKAKHIGKVVCVMPEVKRGGNGEWQVYTPMFNDRSTYLITGGLGGIGFEVCKWMVKMGAKHVILAGRKAPDRKLKKSIEDISSNHLCNIRTVQLDVGDFEQCKDLICNKIPEMGLPQLRGVMHAAGTLHDGLISSQNWDNLSSTFTTKVDGTLNLHELTKNLRMEHFVLFSSIAATLGSPGQCNHSAGNYFEDTFAHYRNSIGLPAVTVNWGQWSEVGIATEVDLPGLKPLSNLQAVTALDYALKSQRTQICVLNVESLVLVSKLLPQVATFIDERVWRSGIGGGPAGSGSVKLNSEQFWQQYDSLSDTTGKSAMVQERVSNILRDILKLDESEILDDNSNFQDMGVDSLMFVEIKNEVQALLGDRIVISANAVRHCNTIGLLTQKLVNLIEGEDGEQTVDDGVVPTTKEVNQLIKEDSVIPDFIRPKPEQTQVKIEQVSRVLVTGCSGTLGPYVLKELSLREQIREIVCLMRPSRKHASVDERIRRILAERDLLDDVDMPKIRFVTGNVALPKLGLEADIWNELCDNVDGVIHCAASIHHVELYKKRESTTGDNNIRDVNIGGLKNVLEFSCSGRKLKHVFNASSIVAVAGIDPETGNFSEKWPNEGDYNGVTNLAYPVTKFVGDMVMKEAVAGRGIPGKTFRFPLIVGDSRDGRFVLDQNHLMLRYLFILKNGMMPSNPIPMAMLPVDICAKVSIHIFFHTEAPNGVYNVVNDCPDTDQEFVRIADRLGHKVDIVEFSEFNQRLRQSTPGDSPFAIFKDFYKKDEDILALYNSTPALKQWVLEGGKSGYFKSRKIEKLMPEFYTKLDCIPTMEYIYKDLLYAKSHGWLQKYDM